MGRLIDANGVVDFIDDLGRRYFVDDNGNTTYGLIQILIVLGDYTIDNGLTVLNTDCDAIYICSERPTTYNEATLESGGYALGNKNLGAPYVFTAPDDISGGIGRSVTSTAITDGSITADGDASFWAAVDTLNSRLLASGQITNPQTVVTGRTFTLASFDIELPVAFEENVVEYQMIVPGSTIQGTVFANLGGSIRRQVAPGFGTSNINE